MSSVAGLFAISYALGPVVGGTINNNTTWRWVFLLKSVTYLTSCEAVRINANAFLSVPAGVIAMAMLLLATPSNFPYQFDHPGEPDKGTILSRTTLERVDFLGVILLLTSSVLLVCALEEAGYEHRWSSSLIVSLLVFAGVLWMAFFAWERYIDTKPIKQESVLPWALVSDRAFLGMLLYVCFPSSQNPRLTVF